MSYKQVNKFGYRDSLEQGDPEKVIYGADFDTEFEAIEKAIEAIDPNADGGVDIGEIDGLQDALDGKADKNHTHVVADITDFDPADYQPVGDYLTDAPNDGRQYVRESEAWAEVVIPDDTGIPEPASDGTPYARQVEGGQAVGAWVEAATPEDIEYLDGRIDAIEGNISGGGGFVEAPNDGADYARNGKSPAWVKTYNADYIDDLETDYKNADSDLQDQIDAIPSQDFSWDSITGKPSEFPPAAHTQDWSTITNTPADFPPSAHSHGWDEVTGKPTEFPPEAHTHTTDEITGLDGELAGIKDDINDLEGAVGGLAGQLAMGGSYDASTGLVVTANLSSFTAGQPLPDYSTVPNTFVIVSVAGNSPEELSEGDWLVAGSSGWVPIKYGTAGSVEWDNIQNVPTEFPPEAHGHGWDEITGKPTEFPSANAVLLTGDQTVAGHKTWTGIATFGDTVTMRGILNGDVSANFGGPVTATSFVKTGGTSDQYLMADGSVSTGPGDDGAGSSVHIGEAPPDDPQEGQQWMEVPADGDATMWIYDGGKWLQQPGGKDGAPGADGNIADATEQGVVATWDDSAKQWTPSSALIADNVNVGIGAAPARRRLEVTSSAGIVGQFTSTNASYPATINFAASDSTIQDGVRVGARGDAFLVQTSGGDRLTIDASGDATFSGKVNAGGGVILNGKGGLNCDQNENLLPISSNGAIEDGVVNLGRDTTGGVLAHRFKDGYFTGTVNSNFVRMSSGLAVGTRDLIETLSTLRNATKDETTLEGLRDAIGNAVGGLIEKFEAMQSTATQEIEA